VEPPACVEPKPKVTVGATAEPDAALGDVDPKPKLQGGMLLSAGVDAGAPKPKAIDGTVPSSDAGTAAAKPDDPKSDVAPLEV